MKNLLLFFFFLIVFASAYAQDTTANKRKIYTIRTQSNQTYKGELLGEDEKEMRIKDSNGIETKIPKDQIRKIEIDEITLTGGDKMWIQTPNRTRYLLTPSGYSLRKKEAYYQNTYFFLHNFYYGLTDRITLGGGIETFSFFMGRPIFFIMPKVSFPISKNWNAAAGVLYINMLGRNESFGRGLGITYGVLTYGSENTNITGGLGYGFVDKEWSKSPMATLSGTVRLSNRVALVSENWIIPDGNKEQYFISYGVRFMWRRIAFDIAIVQSPTLFDTDVLFGIPFLDLVVKL